MFHFSTLPCSETHMITCSNLQRRNDYSFLAVDQAAVGVPNLAVVVPRFMCVAVILWMRLSSAGEHKTLNLVKCGSG